MKEEKNTISGETIPAPRAMEISIDQNAGILAVIERAAANPDVDVDKMQKLLDMQIKIMDKQAEMAYSVALAEMQPELPMITEKGEIKIAGEVRSKYARFEDINEAIKPYLKQFGFSIQFKIDQEKDIKVTAILRHKEGHSDSTSIVLPADTSGSKNIVQAAGSSVEYGKRYTLKAILNISTGGLDDDAQASDPVISQLQADKVSEMLGKCTEKTNLWFEKTFGEAESVKKASFDQLMAKLKIAIENSKEKKDETQKNTAQTD